MIAKLQSRDLAAQLDGAYGLGMLGARAAPAIPALLRVMGREEGLIPIDSGVVRRAREYLGTDLFLQMGEQRFGYQLAQSLCSRTLASIGPPAFAPTVAALRQANPSNAYYAYLTETLARLPDPRASRKLIELLQAPTAGPRARAAEALAYSADTTTLSPLIAALEDPDRSVRDAARQALETRSQRHLGENPEAWRAWRAELFSQRP